MLSLSGWATGGGRVTADFRGFEVEARGTGPGVATGLRAAASSTVSAGRGRAGIELVVGRRTPWGAGGSTASARPLETVGSRLAASPVPHFGHTRASLGATVPHCGHITPAMDPRIQPQLWCTGLKNM
jgi:hypothetical protein